MLECDCTKCDPNYQQEYQKWHDDVERFIKEQNLQEFDQMIIWAHMPIHLLRLPCRNKTKLSKQEQLDNFAEHSKREHA